MRIRKWNNNRRPFSAVCQNEYGRQVIYTNQREINASNIVQELSKANAIHMQNAEEIAYLNRYYTGDQPILYREKANRPEVNNKVVQNLAYYIVETKASEIAGEPIQYVLRGTEESKSSQIAELNSIMDSEDKACDDIELCRWRSICGTGYRFVGNDNGQGSVLDESEFFMNVENPLYTYVVYFSNSKKPAFSCQISDTVDNKHQYFVFTNTEWFLIQNGEIVDSGINGNRMIPVVEYPNNERRLSDIEITIAITDELNVMASDRANGIEQFVSAWVKFVNCEIDEKTYRAMRQEGALVVKSNNGSENKADVDVMTTELNQTESQVAVQDQLDKLLIIQGIAGRGNNSGGDTQGAVLLRDGFYVQEKRAEMSEPIFKRSERAILRIMLNRLRISKGFDLTPSDVEIKISRSKMDNMLTKAETMQILLNSGINPERAIKSVGFFADPEQVAIESKDRMDVLYPTEIPAVETQSMDERVNINNEFA